MPRRFVLWFLAAYFLCAVNPVQAMRAPAAKSHVVAQKTVKKGIGGLTLYGSLKPGHKYRIEVISTGKFSVTGNGFQTYTYKNGKQVSQGTKGFALKGKTPYSVNLQQPTQGTLLQWVVGVQVTISGKQALTVRYWDLGSAK